MYARTVPRTITVHGYPRACRPQDDHYDERLLLTSHKPAPMQWGGARVLALPSRQASTSLHRSAGVRLAAIDEGEEPGDFYEQRALGGPGVRAVAGSGDAAAPLLIEAREEAAE